MDSIGMKEVEYKRVTIADWPDGSTIYVDNYRADPVAPWSSGPYEGRCGTCKKDTDERPDIAGARIAMLEHQLFHAREEIQEIHRKLARKATSVSFRNG